MMNWEKELEDVLNHPLFDDVKPIRKKPTSSDRLVAGFQEVCAFYETNGRLPEDTGGEEGRLFHRLSGILKDEKKINRCRPFDEFGILPDEPNAVSEPEPEYQHAPGADEQLDAILNDPLFDDIQQGKDLGLFDVPEYMRQRLEARKQADYVGRRVPCEDFAKYEDGFKEIHLGLKSGRYRLIKFSIKNLKAGRYFIEDGMIGFLAAVEDSAVDKYGTRDGRTRIIYENGTESDIKFKTLTKNLSVTGYSIQDCSDISTEELQKQFSIGNNDVESGMIYVLKSKSTLPEIAGIKDLYKIGFTVTSVESRIANAKNEPTYLCADVEVAATWKVYNVKSSTFEALIHKLFAPVQLQITVDGHTPKEWFVVPFNIIEQAVVGIIKGEPMMYDPRLRQLVMLKTG